MSRSRIGRNRIRANSLGFTLIELMIAMLLGLLVVAAAGAIFVSNRQTYVATESLGRVQESARVAFEIMARDLRGAGGNPCDRYASVAPVLKSNTDWWSNWNDAVVGYPGSASVSGLTVGDGAGERVVNTEVIELKSATSGVAVVSHVPSDARFVVQSNSHGLAAGDLAIVCDYTQASVFQVSGVSGGGAPEILHDVVGVGAAGPGNCTKGLGLPVNCDGGTGTIYIYDKNSTIAKIDATRWYIGNNDRDGTSLFRQTRRSAGGGVAAEEVVSGVRAMQLQYLVAGSMDYVPASSVPNWAQVNSVRATLIFQGEDRVGGSGERIERTIAYVASLRNRNR